MLYRFLLRWFNKYFFILHSKPLHLLVTITGFDLLWTHFRETIVTLNHSWCSFNNNRKENFQSNPINTENLCTVQLTLHSKHMQKNTRHVLSFLVGIISTSVHICTPVHIYLMLAITWWSRFPRRIGIIIVMQTVLQGHRCHPFLRKAPLQKWYPTTEVSQSVNPWWYFLSRQDL